MKKLKMMLLSFALLSIVGGTLAVKAKFNSPYCTSLTNGVVGGDVCTVAVGVKKFCPNICLCKPTLPALGNIYCYTMDQDGVLDCSSDPGSGILETLRCGTTSTFGRD